MWPVLAGAAEPTDFHKAISVEYKNLPLSDVLKDLQERSGVQLTLRAGEQVEQADFVTFQAKHQAVGRVLTRILMPRRMKLALTGDKTADVMPRSDREEYQVQRQETFGFKQEPTVTRQGDLYSIRFETTSLCDVSVAVEDNTGRIIRHLASGVLGLNAPDEFVWNSTRQTLVWDGKDDAGVYFDDVDSLTVRVSLGLKPRLERTLYWAPEKRTMALAPRLVACEEGVLLYEGQGVDKLLLFDRDGEYRRTVYPFPRGKLEAVVGMKWRTSFRDGSKVPQTLGFNRSTLLTSGNSSSDRQPHIGGLAATAMAARGQRIVLARDRINRLALDGSTGGRPLAGARTNITGQAVSRRVPSTVYPTSAAISPDEKWLYLAGYGFRVPGNWSCLGVVQRVTLDGEGEPELFPPAAVRKTKEGQFVTAMSVDCDEKGNVYVADYIGDCIKVFAPDGAFLKSISVRRPAVVRVHRRTQDIMVLSYMLHHPVVVKEMLARAPLIAPLVHHFGPLDKPNLKRSLPLPLPGYKYILYHHAVPGYLRTTGEVDSWADELTVWVSYERNVMALQGAHHGDGGRAESFALSTLVMREKDGKMQILKDFGKVTAAKVARVWPSDFSYQRLYAFAPTGELFIKENQGPGKSHFELVRINPDTGRARLFPMPFDAEDVCFDRDGRLYMRTDTLIARYDVATMREVPWDYGEEHRNVGFSSVGTGRRKVGRIISALRIPCIRPVHWHMGGMNLSAVGRLAVAVNNEQVRQKRLTYGSIQSGGPPRKYTPRIFPGRLADKSVHVFNQHGETVYEDAFPGITRLDGIGIDNHDNLFVMADAARRVDGKPVFPDLTGTLMKARAGRARILSGTGRVPVPLGKEQRPQRPPDLAGRTQEGWGQGVEWFYGGLGVAPTPCSCWHGRFWLDDFARSFAPETVRQSVAVLDTNGNLILRIGKYGNVDDGVPLEARGGPPSPRSIGGDEVGLFFPAYVTTHTDRRLFIADSGNFCVRSVKLGYHVNRKISLANAQNMNKIENR